MRLLMSNNSLICKNDDCKGTNFEQVSGSSWKCVDCGTITTLSIRKVITKKRPKKEKVAVKEYPPLVLKCEQCGAIVGTLHRPSDDKKFNDNWFYLSCSQRNSFIQ